MEIQETIFFFLKQILKIINTNCEFDNVTFVISGNSEGGVVGPGVLQRREQWWEEEATARLFAPW